MTSDHESPSAIPFMLRPSTARPLGLRTVSLTDTAVQSTGVDGGGSASVRPFGSPKLHQTETGGCKTAVNGCRRPSIPLTSTKMIYLPGDPLKYEVGCDLPCRKEKLKLFVHIYLPTTVHNEVDFNLGECLH